MTRSASAAARRTRAVESFGSAAECIGDIEHGMSLFAVTRGQFSMLDIVSVLIEHVGACNVSCWTWAIADYEVQCFEAFMTAKQIESGRLIIDRAAENRNPVLIEDWRIRFGVDSVRVCKNHAKIATVSTPEWRLLVRGSMNLNFNPRFEQFDITEGGPDFDLVKRLESELPVLPANASAAEVVAATKLGRAYEAKTLDMFGGVKVWAK